MSEQKIDELETYRTQIDVLDRRLLDLLNERTAIVEQIGRVKQERKLGVYEPKREDQVYANILRNNRGPLPADAVKRKDFFARAEKHLEFHLILAKATRNPIMDVIMESLIGVMRQFIQTIGPHNIVDYALASRQRFMAYFEARDAENAVKEMEEHLKRVNRNYVKVLGARGKTMP